MEPINAWVVISFQFGWFALACALLCYIVKLKDVIVELRSTLYPFVRLYENDKYKETNLFTHHNFKRAFDVYTEDR